MFPTHFWIVMKQSTNLEWNEPIVEWDECEMLTHSQHVRELDLAMCVSPSSNGSKMRSLWTNQMKS